MSSCITKDLSEATAELNDSGLFSNQEALAKPIEELLDKDDKKLKAILDFRNRVNLAEAFDKIKSANRLERYFMDNGVINPMAQIYIMFSLNARVYDIELVTGLSKKLIGKNPIARNNRQKLTDEIDNDIRTIEVIIKDMSVERLHGIAKVGEQEMNKRNKGRRKVS